MTAGALVIAALALAVVLARRNRPGLLLQYLYFCRFPVLLALVLAGLGAAGYAADVASLTNLFWLAPDDLFLVSWLAVIATWVSMLAVENILRYAPARFRVEPLRVPRRLARFRVPLFAALALPVVGAALARSASRLAEPPYRPWQGWAAAAGGIAFAVFCLLASAAIHAMLRDPEAPAEDLLLPGSPWLFRRLPSLHRRPARRGSGESDRPCDASTNLAGMGPMNPQERAGDQRVHGRRGRLARRLCLALPGYFDPERLRPWPGHVVAVIFFLITLGIYLGGYLFLDPSRPAMPALGALLFVLVLLGWALTGLSFFLDRFRVPVLSLLVALVVVSSRVSDTDHYYRFAPPVRGVTAAGAAGVPAPTPVEAFAAAERAQLAADRRPVVVVAASGGGITASLWTATVLAALQREAGPRLAPAIRFVSAVSGGSVGAMYFLDRFPGAAAPSPAIVEAAGQPSLDSVAWGIAYPDLWRFFFSYLLHDPILDRGWAMEQAWRRHMRDGGATLAGWRAAVGRGELPAFAFNATVAETGEQFLFTPLALPDCGPPEMRRPECWRARSFLRDYSRPGRPADVPVATAARMSATFPWVSPIARAADEGGRPAAPRLHLADGGYYDNFGVVTAVNWLQSLLPAYREELARRRVILVLIRAFPERDPAEPQGGGAGGWFYTTVGPLSTIYEVRTATQAIRNDTEIGLLRQALAGEGVRLDPVLFELAERSPLSWKLTGEEKRRIEEGWKSEGNQAQLAQFLRLFAGAEDTVGRR